MINKEDIQKYIYAEVIVNISHEAVDRPFTYRIPDSLRGKVTEGVGVSIPFGTGNTVRKGYVVALKDTVDFPPERIKDIISVNEKGVELEGRLMELAVWMKKRYGSTLISCIQTVLPVKKKIKNMSYKTVKLNISGEQALELIGSCRRNQQARKTLLNALIQSPSLPLDMIKQRLGVSVSVVNALEKQGTVEITESREYRIPKVSGSYEKKDITLSEEQRSAADHILARMHSDDPGVTLLHGITGSGKTEVYMELIDDAIKNGKQAIVLIPEIALSFQTLLRFYARYGKRVSVIHSRLSDGERFDQFERAKNGELDVIIGPRSALFTPFKNTGIIIIDEEHENSYKSEKMPKYHAVDVAKHIAKVNGCILVLGSATPSMESYYRAKKGDYALEVMKNRNGGSHLATVHTVDMREELKKKNKSYFSTKLKELITDRMIKGEQTMLFINRRGFVGFVSCRECGYVLKCPHCEVSMSEHLGGGSGSDLKRMMSPAGRVNSMVCHYCGYEMPKPPVCPECGSKYFAGFRAGTEKIEQEIKKMWPSLRVLRMDGDTTKNKDDYDRILSSFSAGEADVLVGTQMIVKGHDFPNVTLVGVIAADMSLYAADYHSAERTFQLIAQAAGRAGRGTKNGDVVIQTYKPENYAIKYASDQDYEGFYEEEMLFREMADYPPVSHMMSLQLFGDDEDKLMRYAHKLTDYIKTVKSDNIFIIGPSKAVLSKIKDVHRAVIHLKSENDDNLIALKDLAEEYFKNTSDNIKDKMMLQFDLDPVSSF